MNIFLNEAQIALQDKVRKFARSTLGANLEQRDIRGASEMPEWRPDWRACADFGLFRSIVPESLGGDGRDSVSAVAMLEALGEGCPDNGLTLAVNAQIWTVIEPILEFGSEDQVRRWIPGLMDGSLFSADGITEAASGSDAMALTTSAVAGDGGYVLNGEKVLIGMAPACDLALVFATVNPDLGRWGVTAFLVSADDEGVDKGPADNRMGLRTVPSGSVKLTDCWIPEDRRLGQEGDGAAIFQHSADMERCFIFSSHVGSMARQLSECVAYSRKRKVFERPISEFQSVSNRLADMRLRLETCRLLLYQAAVLRDRGAIGSLQAALVKLQVSEAFVASSLDALRTMGGREYRQGSAVDRDIRDALGGVIYGGTSDIQRNIVAALLETSD